MAKKLDPEIGAVLKRYGFGPDACWDCHGTWVVYHKVLERIAANERIEFDPPQVIESDAKNKVAVICVTGRLNKETSWSIGEATPHNNKNSYPYAMAEKRAKDRVILKLIGLHGFAYSEEEAEDFKAPQEFNSALSPEQKEGLIAAIKDRATDNFPYDAWLQKMLAWAAVENIDLMPASKFDEAMELITKNKDAA